MCLPKAFVDVCITSMLQNPVPRSRMFQTHLYDFVTCVKVPTDVQADLWWLSYNNPYWSALNGISRAVFTLSQRAFQVKKQE